MPEFAYGRYEPWEEELLSVVNERCLGVLGTAGEYGTGTFRLLPPGTCNEE